MLNTISLIVVILALVCAVLVGLNKLHKIYKQVNSLYLVYKYYLRPENKEDLEEFIRTGTPPINGGCPSEEELRNDNLD